MLLPLLYNLRSQGVRVGIGEWIAFLTAIRGGLATSLQDLYQLGRAVLIHSEANFDAYDLAFSATFQGVELPEDLTFQLAEWLKDALAGEGERAIHDFGSMEELRKEFERRLKEQKDRHDGGRYWIGTGGTSPFGNGGRADGGVRIGGQGGGRGAVQVADERRWAQYRTDMTLDIRDFKVALRELRNFAREGDLSLDIPGTIEKTSRNGGEIELDWRPSRVNRMRVVLLLDTGGSMDPHAALVSRLFTAANELKSFKTFDVWYFHNCPYRYLYSSYEKFERRPTGDVLDRLTPEHRVVWVGDACMAPWELFSSGWGEQGPTGFDWIRRYARACPNSVWLNPDPPRFWDHATVSAIGATMPMYPLSVDGLKRAVRRLRGGQHARAA